jgi:carbon-monoxide dehydrogenase medium subunit
LFPRSFEYFAPETVRETTAMLQKYGEDAKVLAGGMSLIPVMKFRLASPTYIIDINRLSGLRYIKELGNRVVIGALTRHHAIETSKLIQQKLHLMSETASWIGDPQVRNRGTIGGSLSHADPSGDWGATVLALRADLVAKGVGRERTIRSDDFFIDTFTTALKPNELLTEIRIPLPAPKSGGAYTKLERKAGDFATVGVAAQIRIDQHGLCKYAGIALTAVGPKNLRAKKAEATLLGKEVNAESIEQAAHSASEDAQPANDPLRGSVEYRTEMTKVFTRRALTLALKRANGGK